MQQQSIFGISKSVELSGVLINLNHKFHNDDWVDRLTWRLSKLIKLQATMVRAENQEVTVKAQNMLKQVFWNPQAVVKYKVTSGLLPSMLQ